MKIKNKKIIVKILIILLLIQPLFLTKPKEVSGIVPVFDAAHTLISTSNLGFNTITAAQTTQMAQQYALKEFTLDTLAWMAAEILLRQLLVEITNWVNRGFQGQPAFLTDPTGFLFDVGNIVAGEYISNIDGLEWLCQPYNISLALAFKYDRVEREYCRLTDILTHGSDALGKLGSDLDIRTGQGWRGFFTISQNPKSYRDEGMFLEATGEIELKRAQALDISLMELNWGQGLFSARDRDGNVVTPGIIVQDQITSALNIPRDRLVIADEINELIGALLNQLILKLTDGGGLLGLGDGGDGFTSDFIHGSDLILPDPPEIVEITDFAYVYFSESKDISVPLALRKLDQTLPIITTEEGDEPWILIILDGGPHNILSIEITGGGDGEEFMSDFYVFISNEHTDMISFEESLMKANSIEETGGASYYRNELRVGETWSLSLGLGIEANYIKIQRIGTEKIFIEDIKIFKRE